MRKKIFIAIGILLLLIIIAGVAIPILYKGKIMEKVKTSANENLNAKLDFKDIDISLFKHFPNLTLTIDELSVIGIDEFKDDTLCYVKELSLTVDLMSVIKGGTTDIKAVNVNTALVDLIGLKDGKVNWNIIKPSSEKPATSTQSSFNIALKKYKISNTIIKYRDDAMGISMEMLSLNHTGDGDFTQDLFILNTMTNIDELNLVYGGVKYFYHIKTSLKADLEMDMKNSKYTFKENELTLNELPLNFDGYIAMPGKDITMDIKLNTPKNDFKNFMSLIPGVYRKDFKNVQSSGNLALNGFVKGTYNDHSMPGYGLNVQLGNGKFQYPALSVAINNVNMDLKVNNADGITDHTIVNLNKLHIELGTEPFDARLSLKTPISNATFEGMMKGKVNLGDIGKMIPLEEGTIILGMLISDLNFNGDMKAVDNKEYQNMKADGSFSLIDFNYTSKDYKQGMKLNKVMLTFNPKNVTLNAFDAVIGHSDIQVTGSLDNLLPFYFKKNELLKGDLKINSKLIDINEMMAKDGANTSGKADTTRMNAMQISEYVDFVITATIGKVLFENMELTNLKGNIAMRDKTLGMNAVSFNTMDGSVVLNGIYNSKDMKNLTMNFDMSVKDMDIRKTATSMNTVKKMAPIAQHCNGKFSTQFNVAGKLDSHMQPAMNTLDGGGKLQTNTVTVSDFGPLNKVADAIKMPKYKQLALNNLNISFKFKDGRVDVDPFETTIFGNKAKISGSNGFDETIDYTMAVAIPKSELGNEATSIVSGLLGRVNSAVGSNLTVPDPVNIKLNIGGTVTKPVVKTGLGEGGVNAGSTIKNAVQTEIDNKKKVVEDKAKVITDSLKKQAQDKIKKEAGDKLKNIFGK